jgi:ectoine hydroxylase-related dioxygenase (phytanoyl-CoA dioxygenase family)
LDDAEAGNGGLRYYPGSHVMGTLGIVHLDEVDGLNEGIVRVKNRITPVTVTARAGDAVVHNCCTIHEAFSNTAASPRIALAVQFMPDGSRCNGRCHDLLRRL